MTKKVETNYTTKTAFFLLHVILHGEVQANSSILKDNEVHIKWGGQDLLIQRSVNIEYSRPHYEYTMRTINRAKMYCVGMSEDIQETNLHSRIWHAFMKGLDEGARKLGVDEYNKIVDFNYLESKFFEENKF